MLIDKDLENETAIIEGRNALEYLKLLSEVIKRFDYQEASLADTFMSLFDDIRKKHSGGIISTNVYVQILESIKLWVDELEEWEYRFCIFDVNTLKKELHLYKLTTAI